MIRYPCDKCGTGLESPGSLIGKTEVCPMCQAQNVVPGRSMMPEGILWQGRPWVLLFPYVYLLPPVLFLASAYCFELDPRSKFAGWLVGCGIVLPAMLLSRQITCKYRVTTTGISETSSFFGLLEHAETMTFGRMGDLLVDTGMQERVTGTFRIRICKLGSRKVGMFLRGIRGSDALLAILREGVKLAGSTVLP